MSKQVRRRRSVVKRQHQLPRLQKLTRLILPESVIAFRHAEHTYKHIEHAFERVGLHQERIAHKIASAITGGPLSVTIGATIVLEDMPEVPEEELAALEADIYAILAKTGIQIVEEAKAEAPVRTGLLRESIVYTTDNEALAVTVSANTGYAKYVEYGTSRMEAKPFLLDAAESHQQELDDEIDEAIQSHLDGKVEGDGGSMDLEIESSTTMATAAPEASEALAGFGEFAELVGL